MAVCSSPNAVRLSFYAMNKRTPTVPSIKVNRVVNYGQQNGIKFEVINSMITAYGTRLVRFTEVEQGCGAVRRVRSVIVIVSSPIYSTEQ